jgi:hypothetical protein
VAGNGSGFERQPVILEAGEDRSGIRTEHYLLLRTGAEERLYDLARDPREQEDLLATGWGPRELADLRARLDEALALDRGLLSAFEGAPGRPDSPGLSPRERRRLRGLGYAGKGR